jgi:hypothetical protein
MVAEIIAGLRGFLGGPVSNSFSNPYVPYVCLLAIYFIWRLTSQPSR